MASSWSAGAVRTDEFLITAAMRGDLARVKEYLDHGAISSARNHHLLTALHWAVTMGHMEVVEVRRRARSLAPVASPPYSAPVEPQPVHPDQLARARSSWWSAAPT